MLVRVTRFELVYLSANVPKAFVSRQFHHTRIYCARKSRTFDVGVKVPCLTAWRWRIMYPAYKALLHPCGRAGNNKGSNLDMYQHKLIVVENVRFELRFLLPKQACYHYTTFSSMPPKGVEPSIFHKRSGLSGKCMPIPPRWLIKKIRNSLTFVLRPSFLANRRFIQLEANPAFTLFNLLYGSCNNRYLHLSFAKAHSYLARARSTNLRGRDSGT